MGKSKHYSYRGRKKRNIDYGEPIQDSIAVDGSSSMKTGECECRGVYTNDSEELFRTGTFIEGTNNIMEFLAIVHGLMFCQNENLSIPIYSDSVTALTWVNKKAINTNQPRTENNADLFEIVDESIEWLHNNDYPNDVLKWHTKVWGEIPADFNRK